MSLTYRQASPENLIKPAVIVTDMSSAEPPKYSGKFTIGLFGKEPDFLRRIENVILRVSRSSATNVSYFTQRQNSFFRVISSNGFFKEYHDRDQRIIDFMALSDPGPHRFLLAIDRQNAQENKVVDQIIELQDIFGYHVKNYVVIVVENWESYRLLGHLKEMFNIQMAAVNENLASWSNEWRLYRQSFQFEYTDYSQKVVQRRKKYLKGTRNPWHPQYNPGSTGVRYQSHSTSQWTPSPAGGAPVHDSGACYHSYSTSQRIASPAERAPVQDNGAHGLRRGVFNIILLGATGTGKSASANTILTAGKPLENSVQPFDSYPSSTPVTTRCEEKVVELFGTEVRVVDTPDFFYEEERVDQAQVQKCRKYCQEGHCVVLLVIQLGRFTDGERGILEKLENHLGWRIRESTIILFTHGEDLKGSVETFIGQRSYLKHIVEACGRRYHVFKNSSKNFKQVKTLVKRFPDMFPTFPRIETKVSCF